MVRAEQWFSTLFMQRPIFAPEFNLTTPFRKISSQACHMKCSCTIENHNG